MLEEFPVTNRGEAQQAGGRDWVGVIQALAAFYFTRTDAKAVHRRYDSDNYYHFQF